MQDKDTTKPSNTQTCDPSERLERRAAAGDIHEEVYATRMAAKDLRMETKKTKKELLAALAELKEGLLAEMGRIRTDAADRETKMQRWLLGFAASTILAIGTATAGIVTTMVKIFA